MTNLQPDGAESAARVPLGWSKGVHPHTFSGQAGPFYFRDDRSKPGVGFVSEPRHANFGGVIHGGMLMTLADMALFDICFRAAGQQFKAVTVTMNAEFVGPGPIGEFVEASGELVKQGKSLSFVRGLVTAKGQSILAFSGSLKRLA